MNRKKINSLNTKRDIVKVFKNIIFRGEKISVSSIVRDSNINRNTFYYHFSNIKDLIVWYLHDEIYQNIRNYDIHDGDKIRSFVLNFHNENCKILIGCCELIGIQEFHDCYVNELFSIVYEYIDAIAKENSIKLNDEDISFYSLMFAELISVNFIQLFKGRTKNDSDFIKVLKTIFNMLIPIIINEGIE